MFGVLYALADVLSYRKNFYLSKLFFVCRYFPFAVLRREEKIFLS